MRSRKLLYAYGIAAIAMVALVTSAVFVGLSGGNPTPLESSGAQVDGRVHLARIHRWTGMDGVRAAEGGEGVTGAMIRGLEFG